MRRGSAALLMLGLAACATTTEPEFNDEVPVLLEIEYRNFAWGNAWNGYYIDSSGVLYSWNAGDQKPGSVADDDEYTHAELMEKLTRRREKLRDLSATALQEVAELIPGAAKGTLTQPTTPCADAGTLVFRAYTYDSTRGVFKQVLLRSEGDIARKNTSAAAQGIYAYLDGLDVAEHIDGCQP